MSHDLLNKFTPDPGLTQGQLLPGPGSRLSSQSLFWSSEDPSTSQENFKSKKTASVRIKEPNENEEYLSPSSADEDMLSDEEAGQERKKKKRSFKWKWSPFKKVKSLFKRKKSPTRIKSCEALSTEHYKPTDVQTNAGCDDTLRHRTKSEPSLTDAKFNTSFTEPVLDRPRSDLLSNLVSKFELDGKFLQQFRVFELEGPIRIRLTFVVELIRKTNADRFQRFDDILSSLSRK